MLTPSSPARDAWHPLLIEQACRRTLFQAAAAVDAGDAQALAAWFTVDAQLQRPGAAPLIGRAAIEAAYASRPAHRLTRHLLTNVLIEPEGSDFAHAISTVLLWRGNLDDAAGPEGRPAEARQLLGEFNDLLVPTPDGWRIHRRHAHFILHSPEAPPPSGLTRP
ncbi:nuclear transport factor 2 family protein [Curvibacter sp. HBC61]|uniref:Nuclear transport factor 2 family protein n=1 Tax=Curvibacter cyanobacteriorum TaxID=3026422 RepID=A0ABT5MV10_9BURK|nr:nuclear transport factor 2 family protein [Curvibacter sp. HBC61]MDD0837740.1 nuclear transport factor 2 family protein [Curvibacter sp. HBC61]